MLPVVTVAVPTIRHSFLLWRNSTWLVASTSGIGLICTVATSVPPGPGVTSATATCPSGSRVVGGGGTANPVAAGNVIATYPPDNASWTVSAALNPTSAQSLSAYAICAL